MDMCACDLDTGVKPPVTKKRGLMGLAFAIGRDLLR